MWCSNIKIAHCNAGSEHAKGGEHVSCPQCGSPMTETKQPFPDKPAFFGLSKEERAKRNASKGAP